MRIAMIVSHLTYAPDDCVQTINGFLNRLSFDLDPKKINCLIKQFFVVFRGFSASLLNDPFQRGLKQASGSSNCPAGVCYTAMKGFFPISLEYCSLEYG